MPKKDPSPPRPPPPPIARRVGATPTRNAVVAMFGRGDLTPAQREANVRDLHVNAVLTALSTLPRSATLGNITVTIIRARLGPLPSDVSLTTTATRGIRPLTGWDPDHVIRNPKIDAFDTTNETVREDPAARVLADLLDIARRL